MRPKSTIGAVILIVVGVLFLLANFGWIPRIGDRKSTRLNSSHQ